MKKFNAFQIKIFLIAIMLLDHIFFAFPGLMPNWVHALTRGVAPMFAYFLVEGYFHTRNKKRYGIRLLGFAIFMGIGNKIINLAFESKQISVENNIFATLFAGFLAISLFDYARKSKGFKKVLLIILGIIITARGFAFTEGGFSVVPFTLITYFFRGNIKKQIIGYSILYTLIFFMSYVPYDSFKDTFDMLMYNSDFLGILAVPTILMYNGERGLNNKFSKYLFYVFYPLHLWTLAAISFFIS
ncbi:conjugal transfer protein TraX [Paraclostridium bifermentans]|uniref:TraX family protein n=1 Tax=Paraclostridium bifermentans TaxID=1490 RepID=UPI001F2FA697|nr:TraX family protein [Paraclostridium bifermentans]MCE9676710.1 conjugal transfer protein TraX [Paraclostridium bifermentans]